MGIYNFSKLHNIDGIEKCRSLKYFAFGCEADNVDKNIYLESFKKLKETQVEYLAGGLLCLMVIIKYWAKPLLRILT